MAAALLGGCGEDEALVESTALTGDWSGQWTLSFFDEPPTTEAIALVFEDALVVSGRLGDDDFTIDDRDVLFDDRRNGVVYDEGERLFRTNLVLADERAWSLGFLTDASGERALVGDFFSRVGAIQRSDTVSGQPVSIPGRWSGRYVALDSANPDDAEIEVGDLVLSCSGLDCEATGGQTFTLRLAPSETAAWAGTVQGLVENDELLHVRAVATPDGNMLAVGVCARPNDIALVELFCAYAAVSRQE